MRNAVLYKGIWLCNGSKAKELYDDIQKAQDKGKAQKLLDLHLKELDNKEKKLRGEL